jgi:hypothetical protein
MISVAGLSVPILRENLDSDKFWFPDGIRR